METRVLQYFLKIAELGNITKAAAELHITQPTLSRQLQNLEEAVGTPLFKREKRQMILTSAGVLYQQRVQQILADIDKLNHDMQQCIALNGTISIGCVESTGAKFLTDLISEFHTRYPEVKFEIYSGDGDDIRAKLDRHVLDLGILLTPVEIAKYNYTELGVTDTWGILVPKASPLAKKDALTAKELASLPLIVPRRQIIKDEINSWFNIPETSLQIVGSQNLLSNSLELVKNGIGYVICTYGSYMNRPVKELVFLPVQEARPIKHALIWQKNAPLATSAQRFRDFIIENI